MQYLEFLEISIPLLQFLPALFLSFIFLSELRRLDYEHRRTETLAFVAFTFLALTFLYWTLLFVLILYLGFEFQPFIAALQSLLYVSLLGVGLVFLALWTLSLSRAEWLNGHRILISILSILVWVVYVGGVFVSLFIANPIVGLMVEIVFFFLIFGFSLFSVLMLVKSDKKGLLLFFGILFLYCTLQFPGIPVVDPIRIPHITMVGLWLIVLWKLLERSSGLL